MGRSMPAGMVDTSAVFPARSRARPPAGRRKSNVDLGQKSLQGDRGEKAVGKATTQVGLASIGAAVLVVGLLLYRNSG